MRDRSVPTRERRGTTARWMVLVLAAVTLVAACADGEADVRSIPSAGWSSYGGDAGNANFAYPDVPDDLALSWSRPTGGPVSAPLTISGRSNVQGLGGVEKEVRKGLAARNMQGGAEDAVAERVRQAETLQAEPQPFRIAG